MRVKFRTDGFVEDASLVYGALGPVAVHLTRVEAYLRGKPWKEATLDGALSVLAEEVHEIIVVHHDRMAEAPYEGFTEAYREALAASFFYQFFVYVTEQINPGAVPPSIRSAGHRMPRPVTRGTQQIQTYKDEWPVSRPFIKREAFLQASGEVVYTHDIPLPVRGLEAAFVTSTQALARIHYQIPHGDGMQPTNVAGLIDHLNDRFPGFHHYITAKDISDLGGVVLQGSAGDDPLLTPMDPNDQGDEEGMVNWFGQPIALVLAKTEQLALNIAHYVRYECIDYVKKKDTHGKTLEPVLTIHEALHQNPPSIFKDKPPYPVHIWKIIRQGSDLTWAELENHAFVKLDGVNCQVFQSKHESGAQVHFYMETQSAFAQRGEHKQIAVYSSSQSPNSIMSDVGKTLGHLPSNQIDVRIKQLGGSYGGKTTRSPFTAGPAALAAWVTRRPVRLAVARWVDTAMVGKRHPLYSEFSIALGYNPDDPDDPDNGRLMGVKANYYFDGGATYDCSFTVMDCLQLRSDTAYMVPNYGTTGDVCRTNKTNNTAFRAFGLIQSLLAYEDAIERAAHHTGMLAEDVREKNFYQRGDLTPYGQMLDYCYLGDVWKYARSRCDFDDRYACVKAFNKQNRWRKRGISMIAIKYASGYNLTSLNQGGALVEVYDSDAMVLVRHGGVETGQGLQTKISQIASNALNVPLAFINMGETDTQVVPNPVSTGASTGTMLNGGATKQACEDLRARLEAYCLEKLRDHGPQWCREQHINFWDYDEGWRRPYPDEDPDKKGILWQAIVSMAHNDRFNLSAQARFKQPGGAAADAEGLYYKPGVTEEVDHFDGFTYSVACSEVEIDVLTGETSILRSDIVYDVGKSLNPAIDVGQIEGAFVQGLGYVLTEELLYQPDGDNRGVLNSVNTWRYKLPATSTIPNEMHVDIYPREDASEVPENPDELYGAKEVGEPPLVLAITAFLAVKRAILAAREDQGHDGWFDLVAPATVQRVQQACNVNLGALKSEWRQARVIKVSKNMLQEEYSWTAGGGRRP